MNWTLFWAAVAASAAAAVPISAAVAMVLRHLERPEPDWAVLVRGIHSPSPHPDPKFERPHFELFGRLTNAGDGRAFRVTVDGFRCTARLTFEAPSHQWTVYRPQQFVPVMDLGDEMRIEIDCMPEDWDTAKLVIGWTRSPTRKGKRDNASVPLSQIAERPSTGG